MLPRHALVLPLSLLLVACSDSNDDGDAPEQSRYLIGGELCGDSTSIPTGALSTGEETDLEDIESPSAGLGAPSPISSLNCGNLPPTNLVSSNLPPTGSGALMFDGQTYELDSAIRLPSADSETEPRDGLLLHDGETQVRRDTVVVGNRRVQNTSYGAYDATLALSLKLLRAGPGIDPSGRVYDVVPGEDAFDAQRAVSSDVAINTLLVIDTDGDGTISSAAELFEPASGQVVWSGTELAPLLTFTFVLEDGRAIEGSYEGGYERIDQAP